MDFAYLGAAVLFIVGLKWMAAPATARKGNFVSAVGMFIAVLVTLFDRHILGFWGILGGLAIGSSLGAWASRAVKMTAMPQMVAVLNGFGGLASLLVAAGEWHRLALPQYPFPMDAAVTIYASTLVGAVTFSGSMVAAGKLQEIISGRPILFRMQHALNAVLAVVALGIGVHLAVSGAHPLLYLLLGVIALALGVLLVIPIGGADMPVVICLLNSYSGIAAALTGFVISNHGLIITGALVGASGLILTQIMCKAMNRSLANVLFGGLGATVAAGGAGAGAGGAVRQISPEDAGALLAYAETVAFVPGYGLAVAQAQHVLRELSDLLEGRGVKVVFGIHPVAGRMPGHMNVLLAEANVSYDKLLDMEVINPQFERTDVVVVVGANDVVNPAARNTPSSPLYGMPILDVDKARQIIFMKRSLNPGFAGVDNELFYNEKTSMLFGDAAKTLAALVTEVKQV
jgi:NAD(P) transhydrogenase subunit beta